MLHLGIDESSTAGRCGATTKESDKRYTPCCGSLGNRGHNLRRTRTRQLAGRYWLASFMQRGNFSQSHRRSCQVVQNRINAKQLLQLPSILSRPAAEIPALTMVQMWASSFILMYAVGLVALSIEMTFAMNLSGFSIIVAVMMNSLAAARTGNLSRALIAHADLAAFDTRVPAQQSACQRFAQRQARFGKSPRL